MATKTEVLDMHEAHPHWSSVRIAKELGCESSYVRATFYRCGLKLPASFVAKTLEERDRCAAIAERMGRPDIATEIRKGE